MSKILKPCHILDRLHDWFDLYKNQNYESVENELKPAIDELYDYQQKDQQIAELQQQLEHYKGTKLEDYSNEIRELKQQLAEKDNQLHTQPREVVEKIKQKLREQVTEMSDNEHCYLQKAVHWQDIVPILGQILKEYEEFYDLIKADMVEVCDD